MKNDLDTFIQLMKNRLVMGAFRYGLFAEKANYDYFGYMVMKFRLYQQTGNLEMLVDVANMALLCYVFPQGKKHYRDIHSHDVMRRRLLAAVDYERLPVPDKLYQTEWCLDFETRMRNHDAKFTQEVLTLMDNFSWLAKYEYFIAIAVVAFREYQDPQHPAAHWLAVDGQAAGCPVL